MSKVNNKYEESFKLKIVQLYHAGATQAEIRKEYGIPSSSLHGWIKKYSATSPEISNSPKLSPSEIENIELKRQLKYKEMEVDILKQAALIMGRK